MVLDPDHNRTLVDAEVIWRNPAVFMLRFHGKGRLVAALTRFLQLHALKVLDRGQNDLRREGQ
jgi:hypothetical protein